MPDDMFFMADRRSLRRGRRAAVRTEACRPCLVWLKDAADAKHCGVALDISPHGMRIRMTEAMPERAAVLVQMMRDEEFQVPLAEPIEAVVARSQPEPEGFIDHGVRLIRKEIRRGAAVPAPRTTPRATTGSGPRAYTLDVTISDHGRRGRERG